ncbi:MULTISPECIES: hypothetical protein [Burkholderia]|uniref:hypothetical protein n=1 Tax=Burkholderia TaxID=32008 RepID=UPI00040D12E3|nr:MULTISPECIES: hypothetical protein [Burkholderia]
MISNWKPHSQVTPTAAKLRVCVDWVAELMARHAPVANRRRGSRGSRDTGKTAST